jgi:hypothetical protein
MANPTPKYGAPFEAQYNKDQALDYVIKRAIRRMHTAQLVQVLAVTAGTGAVGFLTIQPLVLDQDTNGIVIVGAPIYNVPFLRYQAGPSAVIMDPVVNDIGLAIFAEKDITGTKAKIIQGLSPLGAATTDRTFSDGDAIYLGGVMNPAPTQWVKFLPSGGVDISTTGPLTIEAASVTINAPVTVNSTLATTGETTVKNLPVSTHYHGNVQTGSYNTGPMQN